MVIWAVEFVEMLFASRLFAYTNLRRLWVDFCFHFTLLMWTTMHEYWTLNTEFSGHKWYDNKNREKEKQAKCVYRWHWQRDLSLIREENKHHTPRQPSFSSSYFNRLKYEDNVCQVNYVNIVILNKLLIFKSPKRSLI